MAEQHAGWLALLKWSLAQGSDGTTESRPTMSEEDRKFLESAMKEMVSEPERLRQIMVRTQQQRKII